MMNFCVKIQNDVKWDFFEIFSDTVILSFTRQNSEVNGNNATLTKKKKFWPFFYAIL